MTTNKAVLMDIISESWVSTRLLVESSLNHLQVKTLKLVKTNIWKQNKHLETRNERTHPP